MWTQLPDYLVMTGAPGAAPNCCVNPYDIGCINHCEEINLTTVIAPASGVYKFEVESAAGKYIYFKYFTINDVIILPAPPIELGDISIKIKKPNGEYIKYQLTETILQVCNAPIDVDVIFDCLRAKVEIGTTNNSIINEPCGGTETVEFGNILLISRKGALRATPLAITTLYATTGVKEIYQLPYLPKNGCKATAGAISVIAPVGYAVSDIEHIQIEGLTPYIQFKIIKTSPGNFSGSITLTVSGLCNDCAAPIDVIYPIEAYDCANPADFTILGLFKDREKITEPYQVPEDFTSEELTLEVFRNCCKEKVTVSAVIISSTDPLFAITANDIGKGDAGAVFKYTAPATPFIALVQFTLTACSQTHVFNQTFERL